MAEYSASALTTVTTASAPLFALRGDTTKRIALYEVGIFNVTAPTTSGGIGIARSLTVGTASASAAFAPNDIGEIGTTNAQIDTAWSAAPTIAATPIHFRRFAHGTAIGNGMVWTFGQNPLILALGGTAVGGSLIFYNLRATAAATYDVYMTIHVQ
jgi:hypothetical protein